MPSIEISSQRGILLRPVYKRRQTLHRNTRTNDAGGIDEILLANTTQRLGFDRLEKIWREVANGSHGCLVAQSGEVGGGVALRQSRNIFYSI